MKNLKIIFEKNKNFLSPRKVFGAIRRNGLSVPFLKFKSIIMNVFYEVTFDIFNKVETSTVVFTEDLDISEEDKKTSVRYRPVNIYSLVRAFKLLEGFVTPSETIFMDIGCGKGRALLGALKFGFKQVIGLELSSSLSKMADQQLKSFNKNNFKILNLNALEYDWSDNVGVYFFYQPFSEEIYTKVINSMIQKVDNFFILEVTPRRRGLFKDLGFRLIGSVDDGLGDPHTIIDIHYFDSKGPQKATP